MSTVVLDVLNADAGIEAPHDRPSVRALVATVNRAVDALEGGGARSNRIALQLLEGLVRYENEMATELSAPAPAAEPGSVHDALRAAWDSADARAKAAEATLSAVHEWTLIHGKALCPRSADTYGEGMRDAKQQVSRLISAKVMR